MDNLSGQILKGYELRESIGAGGFGAVYRAFQTVVQREVAIKVILPQYANQPEFIRNFEVEAQIIARLEHLHIIPLFDYWREPDGAYLVMRYLRGGSLTSRLKQKKLNQELTLNIIDQITSALAAAHRAGVIHRDLKPDNILLDEDDNAYLTDFGIAKITGQEATNDNISGTLAYMSPEQLMSAPPTPQADLYSLGVVIFELLAGKHPFDGSSPSQMMMNHINEPLPDIRSVRADLPAEVDDVIQKATAKAPEDRYTDARQIAAALRTAFRQGSDIIASGSSTFIDPSEIINPYKGLRAFQEADSADFFGRELLVSYLLDRMVEDSPYSRFMAVVGPSGSGKSSVVRAGLVPSLRRGGLPGSDNWFIVDMVPGTNPLRQLEAALLSIALRPPARMFDMLKSNESGLLWAVDLVMADVDGDLLIIIDQFEEVFTMMDNEEERLHFLNLIRVAVEEPGSRLRVIITMRADFTDRPLEYVEFGELIRRRTEFILPMSADEIERAITGPATRVGLQVDTDLIVAIVADVREEPGALPLLQYALTEVFQRRDGIRLTLGAYQDSGGVLGALARRAEEVYIELEQSQQAIVRQVFLRMITLGEGTEDTRRRARRGELADIVPDNDQLQFVLDAFGQFRLLTFDVDPNTREPMIEVAHEALIREWDQLRGWLDNSRSDVRLQRVLAGESAEWQKSGRDASFLLSGARLIQYEEWVATTDLALTSDERAYLEASIEERRRLDIEEQARKAREEETARRAEQFAARSRQLTRAATALGVVFVLAVIATFILISQVASTQTQVAEGQTQIAGVVPTIDAAETQVAAVEPTLIAADAQIALAVGQVAEAETQVAEFQPTVDNAQTQIAAVEPTLAAAEAQIAAIVPTLDAAQTQVAGVEPTLDAANLRVEGAETQVASADIQVAQAETSVAIFEPTVIAAETQIAGVAPTLDAAEAQIAAIVPTLDAAQTQVAGVEPTLDAANLRVEGAETQVASADIQVAQAETSVAIFEPTVIAAETQIAGVAPTLDAAEAQIAAIVPTLDAAQTQVAGVEPTLAAANLRVEGAETQVASADIQVAQAETSVAIFEPTVIAAETQIAGVAPTLDAAEAQIAAIVPTLDAAQTQVAGVEPTLAAANLRVEGAETQVASADIQIAQAETAVAIFEPTVIAAETQIAGVQPTVAAAEAQIAALVPTLDSAQTQVAGVEPTLAAANLRVEGAETQVAAVGPTIDAAETQIAGVVPTLSAAETQIAGVEPTLLAVQAQVSDQQAIANALRLVRNAEQLLATDNPDLAIALILEAYRLNPNLGETQRLLSESIPLTVRLDLQTQQNQALFSPDERFLAVISGFSINIWDPQARIMLNSLAASANVRIMVFSPDGQRIAGGLSNGVIQVWDAGTGQLLRNLRGHRSAVLALAYHPTEQRLISGGQDRTAILWDIDNERIIQQIGEGHEESVTRVAFNDNGTEAYSYDFSRPRPRVGVFRLGVEPFYRTPPEYRGLSENGNTAYTGADGSGFLTFWNANTGVRLRFFQRGNAGSDYIDEIAFSPDGLSILVHVEGRAYSRPNEYRVTGRHVAIWSIISGEEVLRLPFNIEDPTGWDVSSLAWSHDSRLVMVGARVGSVHIASVWNAVTGTEVNRFRGHVAPITNVQFSGDLSYALSVSSDDNVRVWDIGREEPNIVQRWNIRVNTINSFGLSDDGSLAYLAYDDQSIGTWDLINDREIPGRRFFTGARRIIEFSPVAPLALAVTDDGVVLWDMQTSQRRYRIDEIQPRDVRSIAFSWDNKSIFIGTASQIFHWDIEAGSILRRINVGANHLAVSRNNEFILAAQDRAVTVIDLIVNQRTSITATTNRNSLVTSVDFSPMGTTIAIGLSDPENSVLLFERNTDSLVYTMIGHRAAINIVKYSSDGRNILSGSDDGTLILWDVQSGQIIRQYSGHSAPVEQVIFSPAGRLAISRSSITNDGLIGWQVETAQETVNRTYASRYVPRITCQQRVQYNVEPQCVDNVIPPPLPTPTPQATATIIPSPTPRPTLTPTSTPIPTGVIRTEGNVTANLRSGPGPGFSLVTQVASGTRVEIIELRADIGWINVRLPDGTSGWLLQGIVR